MTDTISLSLCCPDGTKHIVEVMAQPNIPVDMDEIHLAIERDNGWKPEEFHIVQEDQIKQLTSGNTLGNTLELDIIHGPNSYFSNGKIYRKESKGGVLTGSHPIHLTPPLDYTQHTACAFKVDGEGIFELIIGGLKAVFRTKKYTQSYPARYDIYRSNTTACENIWCIIELNSTIIVSTFDQGVMISVQSPECKPVPLCYLTRKHPYGGKGKLGGQSDVILEQASIKTAIRIPNGVRRSLNLIVCEDLDTTQFPGPFTGDTRLMKVHPHQTPLCVKKTKDGLLVCDESDRLVSDVGDGGATTSFESLKDGYEILFIDGIFCGGHELTDIQYYIRSVYEQHTFWLVVRQTAGEPAHKKRKKD
jgi:hypothetical protein